MTERKQIKPSEKKLVKIEGDFLDVSKVSGKKEQRAEQQKRRRHQR